MKILYLLRERGRPFFYADPSEVQPPSDAPTASAVPRGLVGYNWSAMESWWKESDGATARWSRKTWDKLNAWTRPDEPLLARLRSAESVVIHHPPAIPPKAVRSAWNRYLARRARSHLLWLIVDGFLSPVTGIVFWLLPGPNVIFFWFTYRAYSHYQIVRALHRARWSPPTTTFEADPDLDRAVVTGPDGHPEHPSVEDPANLRRYLERGKPEDHDDDHGPETPAGSGLASTHEA